MGTELLAEGTSKLRTGMEACRGIPPPGTTQGHRGDDRGQPRLADGTVSLNAGIKGDPANPGSPGLLGGSQALAAGASKLSDGSTRLAAGSTQLASGAGRLADGNARIAEGTGTLYSTVSAVSPASMVRQSDAAMALGLVGVLGLGSVGAFLAMRSRRPLR